MTAFAIALATLGALVVAGGTALIYVPAGLVCLGVEMLLAAYIVSYIQVKARR